MFMDKGTDGVAVAAIASPLWLPSLTTVSEVAAHLLPIFGVLWLVIQIVGYVRRNK